MTHEEHLEAMFPEFTPTEDTTVKPFKYYFQVSGSSFSMVHGIVDGDSRNPKSLGWYERTYSHRKRFQFEIDSYDVNNVHSICLMMCERMTKLPKQPLPRIENISGTSLVVDYWKERHDTIWNEVIGTNPFPSYGVSFDFNKRLVTFVDESKYQLYTTGSLDNLVDLLERVDQIDSFSTYAHAGYTFDQSTIGDINRPYDTYTLLNAWTTIDTRKIKYFLQRACERETLELKKELYLRLMQCIDRAARTIVHMSKRFNGTVIKDVTTDGISVDEVKLPYEE